MSGHYVRFPKTGERLNDSDFRGLKAYALGRFHTYRVDSKMVNNE